ncbi:hypothetical protein VF14_07760 [Nostoc linckia z18]|jgi:hypothetical protein|uniref:Uncharacterized protein n=2 Tax=Nostoc linckia TaxID=92942 RepID=A0A9Q5ZFV8_NOSLI|nr:hypothetical protein [Nostoc linckia]PHK40665.1 hypothetical protein VF12_09610 [Nostoc linckia z15]PHK43671.1 hypothetical protein VF13_25870 [Nostoc linckia z16]PHJ63710.1 hypothetical protein VF02_14295 [Nostoc linckia z1]PHJ69316.1 hypothetical protein VF05_14150 [Nostoc linckia z3]PHJ72445.1 hypothetical protein VF03_18300 [Nostoc linckia z2]
MSSDFINLRVTGISQGVIVDKTVADSLPSVDWHFMGGRVVAVLDPAFVGMIDLAEFIGGPSCFAASVSPWNYCRVALRKLKLSTTPDGKLRISINNLDA